MNGSAGGVVLGLGGKVALVCQHGNSWSFPKGHKEEGESFVDAARREIYEETGLRELVLVGELGSYERYSIGKDGVGETKEWGKRRRTFFLFRTSEAKLSVRELDGEVTEARWVKIEEVGALLTHPKDKEFFESIRNQLH